MTEETLVGRGLRAALRCVAWKVSIEDVVDRTIEDVDVAGGLVDGEQVASGRGEPLDDAREYPGSRLAAVAIGFCPDQPPSERSRLEVERLEDEVGLTGDVEQAPRFIDRHSLAAVQRRVAVLNRPLELPGRVGLAVGQVPAHLPLLAIGDVEAVLRVDDHAAKLPEAFVAESGAHELVWCLAGRAGLEDVDQVQLAVGHVHRSRRCDSHVRGFSAQLLRTELADTLTGLDVPDLYSAIHRVRDEQQSGRREVEPVRLVDVRRTGSRMSAAENGIRLDVDSPGFARRVGLGSADRLRLGRQGRKGSRCHY